MYRCTAMVVTGLRTTHFIHLSVYEVGCWGLTHFIHLLVYEVGRSLVAILYAKYVINLGIESRILVLPATHSSIIAKTAFTYFIQSYCYLSTVVCLQAFADDFLKILPDCDNEDFLLECVGILANLPLHEIKIASLMDQYNLISWIKLNLIPGLYYLVFFSG